jgi:uncharacterized membrane protein (DUF106 family)
MEIGYQLTFDDFLSALEQLHIRLAKQRQKQKQRFAVIMLVYAVLIGAIFSLVILLRPDLLDLSFGYLIGAAAYSSLNCLPWIELLAFLTIAGNAQRKPRRCAAILWSTVGVFVLSGIVVFAIANRFQEATLAGRRSVFGVGTMVGWLVLLIICVLTSIQFSRRPMQIWKQQPNLARPNI